jgi:hypothetical protein
MGRARKNPAGSSNLNYAFPAQQGFLDPWPQSVESLKQGTRAAIP